MQGNSGTRLWWIPLERLPTDINCMILDTDDSGKADCLVAGRQGLLASIEPTAGTIHWVSTLNTYPKLPILIPDINGDDIDDLLSVENNSSIVNLVLLSGNNGQLLSRRNTACRSVNLQNLGPNGTITYLCDDAYGKRQYNFNRSKGIFLIIAFLCRVHSIGFTITTHRHVQFAAEEEKDVLLFSRRFCKCFAFSSKRRG